MKNLILLFLPFLFFILFVPSVFAIENPLQNPNNPYGIHIINESDIEDAARLVNSSGGDWGYVTLVIREDEMDRYRWQKVFDVLREKHLIPLVRIASTQEDGNWKELEYENIKIWVEFLDSLNWVVKNRYIIVGNEPNHAKEWGGKISPEAYARYLVNFSKMSKQTSDDFFILPAGLDASAPTDSKHMSEETFIKRMIAAEPNFFDSIDGWTSHSYPNPGFSGEKTDSGKGSIKTYQWEIEYLKNNGLTKELPIFITETGWAHDVLGEYDNYTPETVVSDYLEYAFNHVWTKDENVVAVTPFVLNYLAKPFDIFSWKKSDGSFYEFYTRIKDIAKKRGEPKQENRAAFIFTLLPQVLQGKNGSYGVAFMANIGQSIWEDREITTLVGDQTYKVIPINFTRTIKPFEKGLVYFKEI